jgi:hypothetical protein
MAERPQQADGHPAEGLFDQLAVALGPNVAQMPRRASITRTAPVNVAAYWATYRVRTARTQSRVSEKPASRPPRTSIREIRVPSPPEKHP